MSPSRVDLRVFEDLEELSAAAARALVEAANEAIGRRGSFTIALSGGETPKGLYRRLANHHRHDVPWGAVHLFWSDERLVPVDHPDSNAGAARAILAPLSLPSRNLHIPPTDGLDATETARRYEEELSRFVPLDMTLLGLGEDGHVASLFPGSPSLKETTRLVVPVRDAPKPPPLRITMTLKAINASRTVHVLVSGQGKKEALSRALREDPPTIPAGLIRPQSGAVWWVDRAAWETGPTPASSDRGGQAPDRRKG
jgi:6-phosphogluconolactonase